MGSFTFCFEGSAFLLWYWLLTLAFEDGEHSWIKELGFVWVTGDCHLCIWRFACWSWLSHMILSPKRLNIIIKICLIQLFTSRICLTCICTYPMLSSLPTVQFSQHPTLCAPWGLWRRIRRTALLIPLRSRHLSIVRFQFHLTPQSNLYQWRWV